MVHFNEIVPTRHYLEEHQDDLPWHEVVSLIMTIKNPRKKGDKYEIDDGHHYLLFKIEEGKLKVINAKRK